VRIISGSLKGRRINVPRGLDLRPTTDQAREALFNILQSHLSMDGIQVLDLFAGTGALSFEFISRGAASVLAVEMNARAVDAMRDQAAAWGLGQLNVLRADAFRFLQKTPQARFDIIFADPPYAHPGLPELPDLVLESGFLEADGLFILEHPSGLRLEDHPNCYDTRRYGHVHFSFFSRGSTAASRED